MIYKLILADDHPFLINGIVAALAPYKQFNVVATAHDGNELISMVIIHQPHLVVMDLNMPGMDGFQCLKKLKTDFEKIKVLILTNYSQPELMHEVKAMQADGFMVKNTGAGELAEAINAILNGGSWFKTKQEVITDGGFFMDEFLKKFQLTKREVTIIELICNDKSSKQIAQELHLSELTISTHRRNIFRKLDISSVTGLVNFARLHHII